ncbi:MAG: aminomethyl-transferring glycine dehydrogenase, partial [Candidatus Dadabacteria bacterium]|nr:aminomethyl-transferring glycine dehydrogenase [Candidatus Dadabacteria bacterium]
AARLRERNWEQRGQNKFFVSNKCFPQTIDVLKTRALPLQIELIVSDIDEVELDGQYFGLILQYPDQFGEVKDYSQFISSAKNQGIKVIVASDLLGLTLLKPPGEMGADIVVGSTQRFGVPMGFGGPHAAYFATKKVYQRNVPGRIIGVSIDSHGNNAYRMSLQTREQHIRRDKATSNICTAQSLPAIMASMYAVYHGPEGLKAIAKRIHNLAGALDFYLTRLGINQTNNYYFDTLRLDISGFSSSVLDNIKKQCIKNRVNLRYVDESTIGISVDETKNIKDIKILIGIFSDASGKNIDLSDINIDLSKTDSSIPESLLRTTSFMSHPVFNTNHSETQMLRYIKKLENRDLSLNTSMIPLGSCTMKLNATSEMIPVTWNHFSRIHPFAPAEQTKGYKQIIRDLEKDLVEITGLNAVSLQPNSGAQGEYAGLMVIRAYHIDRGDENRNVVLVPSSAHGTNPASAVMCGMQVVVVKCDDDGNIDIDDLRTKAKEYREYLSAIMVTYPSTHGVFEQTIKQVCGIVHRNGGLVYMDGANMNAQVGLTSPGAIGADVCHLNLHKTFSIPHGGGGPGMGPICVGRKLSKYLPGHVYAQVGGSKAISAVSATPWGSGSILLISYGYIKMLGASGATEATRVAILNANYIKSRLEKYYKILYQGKNGRVAHELIIDIREFKRSADIEVEDIAKRLMDYGFHAPTVSWPVAGTMMIEPTESEPKEELDRFCDALISIYEEINYISSGKYEKDNNVLKNAPHTAAYVSSDEWDNSYSRELAAYPEAYLRENKFWPPVGRINNPYGDKNLVCTCIAVEDYE